MVLADIPGLIEGAAEGVGLGHDFLRHIERTRVLIHLLDGAAADPLQDWAMINQELAEYAAGLEQKPQLVVLNKMDLPDAVSWEPIVKEKIREAGYPFHAISAVTGLGIWPMLLKVRQMLEEVRPPAALGEEQVVITPPVDEDSFRVEREAEGWRVTGRRIERIASMTYFEFDATLIRFQQILEKMGISQALHDAGVRNGDIVYIGDQELEWAEE